MKDKLPKDVKKWIDRNEAELCMKNATKLEYQKEFWGKEYTWADYNIPYEGGILKLMRADSCDQVRSTLVNAGLSAYKPRLGAWITDNEFIVLDSFSDG